jgi:hypothetical protein
MDITILGYKFRVEILIIILLVWWILWGHTVCGCSNVSLPQAYEAFTTRGIEAFVSAGRSNNSNIKQFAPIVRNKKFP